MPTSAGTKVTDPQATAPESVGVVTSDSLAAESLKSDTGAFGQGNPQAAASKQPSHSTTTNNTDTSSATKLDPAADAGARAGGGDEKVKEGKGLGKESGVGPTYNTTTSSTSTSSNPTTTSNTSSSSTNPPIAPTGSYANASSVAQPAGLTQPKGKNLTESADLEGETKLGEIGTEQDPGRVAEQKLAQRAAHPGGDSASRGSRLGDGGSKFGGLGEEEA